MSERRDADKMPEERCAGHLAALFTIFIWGTTFISTKILLICFQPVEILFIRFIMGYLVLLAIYPRRLEKISRKQELTFVAAGFCGICLYYLLENIALTYTRASNVGVIMSAAPFITAILAHFFMKPEEKLHISFFIGFVVAMSGIMLISFNGAPLSLNPVGDILAFLAAFVWACYSLLTRKIGSFGVPVILATRRTFFYGILFMMPALFLSDFQLDISRFANTANLLNMLYLGIGASAICFVTWNHAVKILGVVKTSIYIYMTPVITVITSLLFLNETVNVFSMTGTMLAVIGLFLSGYNRLDKKK
ncbi:MAG: DMT family transporter [Oxalobacter formigenes]|nr:DMT family transporter [Oxalobacter formigenes]